ncbi:hypothetical protein [uncultured Polaribacter sp.]|uniref:hypothetical protein n=1 Tax=uncultured Polaribacter sp. TaxID=174711 RepID=UPI0026290FB3|nr:hypothetical protein [uncultured Polaribacter sp.]
MKKILKNVGVFALTCIFLTSCNENDDNTGASLINYSTATVTLTSSSPTTFSENSIDADDATTYAVTITATLTEVQPIDAVIDLVQTGGTANSSDFEAGTITIKAGNLTASASVNILQTGDIEGTETLEIGAVSRANFDVSSFTHSVSIEDDYINNQLALSLSWDSTATSDDITIGSFCEIDFDLILYDSAFNYLGYVLGSTDCPEENVLYGLADGTYYLVADLYSNPYSSLGLTDTIPLTLSWSQEYFENTTGSISSNEYNLGMGSGLGGLIVVLEVANGYEYTLSEY